jgi:hypothetical protein
MTDETSLPSLHLKHATLPLGLAPMRPVAILADDQSPDAEYEIHVDVSTPEAGCCLAQGTIKNTGSSPLRIKGLRWRFPPYEPGGPALHFPNNLEPQVFGTENFRGDYFGTGTVEGDRFAYPLSNQHVEYGNSEDHTFPGIFIGAKEKPHGLFIAQASQNRFYAIFRILGRMEKRETWLFEIEERVSGICSLELAPGESLTGEKLFANLVDTNDPQHATRAYYRYLRRSGAFARREHNPLPTQRIYCTWNYDFFADVDEEKYFSQIPIVKKYFPKVKFIQLDDGFQSSHAPEQRSMIDLCYGDLEHPFDPKRFPIGPKAVADKVKEAGLRPAIWLALWSSLGSQLIKDHPDWILRDDAGAPMRFEAWYNGCAILDPSVPGVRAYLDKVCRTVFGEWGYEGVKLDFSTFAFNGKRVRFRHPGKTAVELRHEVESIFRRYLPKDGFFGWCVVAGTATPFLSQSDYFRNAVDIDKGNWDLAARIARMTANTKLLLQESPSLPNVDSIGWSKHFNETSWITWLNFCAVSGGALEVSGELRKLTEDRLARLSRILDLSDPDRIVYTPGLGEMQGRTPPLWVAKGAKETLVGVFNWTEKPCAIDLAAMDKTLVGTSCVEVWSGKGQTIPTRLELEPRGSVLWMI